MDRDRHCWRRVDAAGFEPATLPDCVSSADRAFVVNSVPLLRRRYLSKVEQVADTLRASGGHVDALVVLCGLNDVKSCFLPADLEFETCATRPFERHPRRFGEDLATLLVDLRDATGQQCTILVPEEPMADNPRFSSLWPLSAAIRTVSWLWDLQKQQAVLRVVGDPLRCLHVAMPPVLGPSLYSCDGMHPNDRGYQAWGEALACILLGRGSPAHIPELGLEVQVVTTPPLPTISAR